MCPSCATLQTKSFGNTKITKHTQQVYNTLHNLTKLYNTAQHLTQLYNIIQNLQFNETWQHFATLYTTLHHLTLYTTLQTYPQPYTTLRNPTHFYKLLQTLYKTLSIFTQLYNFFFTILYKTHTTLKCTSEHSTSLSKSLHDFT